MPSKTIWVKPDLVLEHAHQKVFHTYHDDDIDQGPHRYWFTLNAACSLEDSGCDDKPCRHVFDVRELSTWQPPIRPPDCVGENDTPVNQAAWKRYELQEDEAIKTAIRTAMDDGELPVTTPATSG